ncbi:MAG: hypothetical protein LCH53_13640 [Bacteroidetes bacterium]|nr:hypothetical protein [Bacteroidota bacterium]
MLDLWDQIVAALSGALSGVKVTPGPMGKFILAPDTVYVYLTPSTPSEVTAGGSRIDDWGFDLNVFVTVRPSADGCRTAVSTAYDRARAAVVALAPFVVVWAPQPINIEHYEGLAIGAQLTGFLYDRT